MPSCCLRTSHAGMPCPPPPRSRPAPAEMVFCTTHARLLAAGQVQRLFDFRLHLFHLRGVGSVLVPSGVFGGFLRFGCPQLCNFFLRRAGRRQDPALPACTSVQLCGTQTFPLASSHCFPFTLLEGEMLRAQKLTVQKMRRGYRIDHTQSGRTLHNGTVDEFKAFLRNAAFCSARI